MSATELCRVAAGVLTVVGSLLYISAVLRGTATPKRLTWFIWGTLDAIVLAGMLRAGGAANWQIIGCTAAAWIIALLALKRGVPGWDRVDTVCTVGAAISIALLWRYPAMALGTGLLAVCIGALPTYRSAWEAPNREPMLPWLIAVASSLVLLPVTPWTYASIAQPLTFLAVNGTVPAIILLKRR